MIRDLSDIIKRHCSYIARTTTFELVTLFWNIGNTLTSKDNAVIAAVSRRLQKQFGDYFSGENLLLIRQFAELVPDFPEIAVSEKITWEHILQLPGLDNEEERRSYIEKTIATHTTDSISSPFREPDRQKFQSLVLFKHTNKTPRVLRIQKWSC
jgi:hypothetical protein